MRNTEQAEQNFRSASSIFWDRGDSISKFEFEYHHRVAEGLTALAAAVRDIYDKLDEIQREARSNSIRLS
jgi:hypothetical protein